LCDINSESGIEKVLHELSDANYRSFFESKNYGVSLLAIVVGLICRDPALNLKQRIRFSKKEKTLFIDLMLNLEEFKRMDQVNRQITIANKMLSELPLVIEKYKFNDFDQKCFCNDLYTFLKKLGWIN
jgi:hypothetical protein